MENIGRFYVMLVFEAPGRYNMSRDGAKFNTLRLNGVSTLNNYLYFGPSLQACLADLGPNRMCEYLYTLSTKFTDFVTNCRVLGSPEQSSRLLLCEATGITMRRCFNLLGMNALDRI